MFARRGIDKIGDAYERLKRTQTFPCLSPAGPGTTKPWCRDSRGLVLYDVQWSWNCAATASFRWPQLDSSSKQPRHRPNPVTSV
ncbi:hypothetical protein VTJ04DRAFT_4615 [Mycothermus thermophilus]|uniref:uncharacterized protein n=1 Tax=Humicola insolens TaxID=85995 RepID=UPI00374425E9